MTSKAAKIAPDSLPLGFAQHNHGTCMSDLDSEALAYHETEILMRVVERLNRPIFILHDCLICKADEALEVGKEVQKEFVQYCIEMDWRPISPAFTIERDGRDKLQVSGERSPFYKQEDAK